MSKHLFASGAVGGNVVLVEDSDAYRIRNLKKSRRIQDINLLSNTFLYNAERQDQHNIQI